MIKVVVLIILANVLCAQAPRGIEIQSLDSPNTPPAIGPYSKATRIEMGDKYMIFTSGSLGLVPATGNLISDDVSEQAAQALTNAKALLEDNGSSFEWVTKALIFLTNMDDFNAINEVYGKFFTDNLPARSCVAVKTLPKNAKFEVEFVAFQPK